MKKAKIMLMAITVLAVTGGVLAFKAKTVNGLVLCTTLRDPSDIDPVGKICSTTTTNYTFGADTDVPVFYTTAVDGACAPDAACFSFAYTKFKE